LHIMQTYNDNWVETVSGLGATGIDLALVVVEKNLSNQYFPSHPIVPLLRVVNSNISEPNLTLQQNFDLILRSEDESPKWPELLWKLVTSVFNETYIPKFQDHVDFQISRGYLGISM